MIEIIPNWHPIFVHFTVALFSTALVFYLLALVLSTSKWHEAWQTVALWNLWSAALVTVATVAAGWVAYNTVTHDAPAHEVMDVHRAWALTTLVAMLAVAGWSVLRFRAAQPLSWLFLAALLVVQGLVLATAWHGAELVYRHGLGVMSLPKVENHQHTAKDATSDPHDDKNHEH